MPASRTPSPAPPDDPTARWEAIRARWLRPSPADPAGIDGHEAPSPAQQHRKERDSVFQQRIATLGELLREANAAATSSSAPPPPPPHLGSSLAPSTAALLAPALQRVDDGGSGAGSSGGSRLSKGKERGLVDEETLDEEVPDGGMPIRDAGANGGQGDPVHELKKVSEGIFLAFKQGRALKEPLPLSLVTSLLYRSWYLDGTIPPNYVVAEPEPLAPIPAHLHAEVLHASPSSTPLGRSSPQPGASSSAEPPRERTPSLLAALSEHHSNAVTPLPSSSGSDPSALPATPPPAALAAASAAPPSSAASPVKPGLHPLQGPSDASPAGTGSGSGTLKLDVLRGSRWRTEKEIASGSDVI
ncbi:hypothetical protein JCM9279_000685 [Rhodotorula babjevae]